jgi:hypothetical protein
MIQDGHSVVVCLRARIGDSLPVDSRWYSQMLLPGH